MGEINPEKLGKFFEAVGGVLAAREELSAYSKAYGAKSAGAVDRRARVKAAEKRVIELAIDLQKAYSGG